MAKGNGWGGSRPGAGRKAGTKRTAARSNVVGLCLTNAELVVLKRRAKAKKVKPATMAHTIIARSLHAG